MAHYKVRVRRRIATRVTRQVEPPRAERSIACGTRQRGALEVGEARSLFEACVCAHMRGCGRGHTADATSSPRPAAGHPPGHSGQAWAKAADHHGLAWRWPGCAPTGQRPAGCHVMYRYSPSIRDCQRARVCARAGRRRGGVLGIVRCAFARRRPPPSDGEPTAGSCKHASGHVGRPGKSHETSGHCRRR